MTSQADLAAMTPSELHVWLSLKAIDIAHEAGGLRDSEDLREWWRAHEKRRSAAGVTPEQEQILIQACKSKIEALGERPREPKPAEKPKRRSRKRRAAI